MVRNTTPTLLIFRGIFYFDFDVTNAHEFKQQLIQKYKHIVSLVCISSGGGGISVLVKINIDLTKDNFQSVWEYITSEVFKDELTLVDPKTKKLPFNEVKKVILSTTFNSINQVIDFNPMNFLEVKIPHEIGDGYKHTFYSGCIHRLVFLNPDLDPSYIYSFIYCINKYKANPPMDLRSLKRLFEYTYNQTQQEGYEYYNDRVKNFHLNKDIFLSKEEKTKIMNRCNGKIRSNRSILKILEAKSELKSRNEKITQSKIAEITGLGIQTVKKHYRVEEIFDINSLIDDINNQYSSNSGSTVNYHDGFTSTITDDLFDNYNFEVNSKDRNSNKDGSSFNQGKVE